MENGKLETQSGIETAPILITGCARSGTSMVGGIINICGAFGGKLYGPTKYNQKGMFENSSIRENVDKSYLKSIHVDPKGQDPLPDTSTLPIPNDWKQKVENIMLKEGYKDGPWFYKGARNCLVWPVWHHAFPDAKWVIVRRRTLDIVDSCLNTAFMNKYGTEQGWVGWVNHHERKFVEMMNEGLNVKIVWPERMINGNYGQMQELIEWLGLEWKPTEVMEFIEPKLWKQRKKLGIIKA